jgi:hypothetical protein
VDVVLVVISAAALEVSQNLVLRFVQTAAPAAALGVEVIHNHVLPAAVEVHQ